MELLIEQRLVAWVVEQVFSVGLRLLAWVGERACGGCLGGRGAAWGRVSEARLARLAGLAS